MVGGKNGEGYWHALSRTWDLRSDLKNMPVKSALAKMRSRISFNFFKKYFESTIESYEPQRRTWRGLRVYATDGDHYELPRSEDILNEGYRGFPFSKEKETHFPRMYVVHCYDVLSGVTKDFRYSNKNEEFRLGVEIAVGLEPQSLALYDRLFLNKDLLYAHTLSGSFFVARCREGKTFVEIQNFFKSSKKNAHCVIEVVEIELIKIINPKNKEVSVYATNLPRSRFKNEEIDELYALRWEIEISNRDMSHTIKVEQWHSKCINGVLQELFAALWLMNQTKIQMIKKEKLECTLKSLFFYSKANFKLIMDFLLDNLKDLLENRIHRWNRRLAILLRVSSENRQRRSRSYKRQVKRRKKIFPLASAVRRVIK